MSRSYTFSPPCASICVFWDFFTFSPHDCIIVLLSVGADVAFEQHVSIVKEPPSGSRLHCPHTHVSVFSNVKIQSVQKVTQPLAYLESVSWTPHLKVSVASTIPYLKPHRLLFTGASQGYCIFKSSSHTARASGQHSAHCGQDINWHIAKRVR
jgi:hypothetical protein